MKNYYAILEIEFPSNLDEIKRAYKVLAKKWHPDINQSSNATEKMQELTEAYYILSNKRAKDLYDESYRGYYAREKAHEKREYTKTTNNREQTKHSFFEAEMNEELKEWIRKARVKAQEYVLKSIDTAKGAASAGIKTAGKAFLIGVAFIILIVVIGLIARIFH